MSETTATVHPTARRPTRARAAGVVGVVLAVIALAGASLGLVLAMASSCRQLAASGAWELDPLVNVVAAGGATIVMVWLGASVSASTVQVLRGAARPRFSPVIVHRAVTMALGAGLVLAPAAAHAATPTAPAPTASRSISSTPTGAGLELGAPGWGGATADAPAATTVPSPVSTPSADSRSASSPSASSPSANSSSRDGTPATRDSPTPWLPSTPLVPLKTTPPADSLVVSTPRSDQMPGADEVVVLRGDSLWRIAARHLGENASAAEIADAWPRWYEANKQVIGHDPNTIRPGQILHAPS